VSENHLEVINQIELIEMEVENSFGGHKKD
jgi:hypothetical protein